MSQSPHDSVFGPSLAPDATFAERKAYREAVGLPGPVDRWLTSNMRTTRIAFLKDYLMLNDVDGADCVKCFVQSVCLKVRN